MKDLHNTMVNHQNGSAKMKKDTSTENGASPNSRIRRSSFLGLVWPEKFHSTETLHRLLQLRIILLSFLLNYFNIFDFFIKNIFNFYIPTRLACNNCLRRVDNLMLVIAKHAQAILVCTWHAIEIKYKFLIGIKVYSFFYLINLFKYKNWNFMLFSANVQWTWYFVSGVFLLHWT